MKIERVELTNNFTITNIPNDQRIIASTLIIIIFIIIVIVIVIIIIVRSFIFIFAAYLSSGDELAVTADGKTSNLGIDNGAIQVLLATAFFLNVRRRRRRVW